jgi:hypothetical protein
MINENSKLINSSHGYLQLYREFYALKGPILG